MWKRQAQTVHGTVHGYTLDIHWCILGCTSDCSIGIYTGHTLTLHCTVYTEMCLWIVHQMCPDVHLTVCQLCSSCTLECTLYSGPYIGLYIDVHQYTGMYTVLDSECTLDCMPYTRVYTIHWVCTRLYIQLYAGLHTILDTGCTVKCEETSTSVMFSGTSWTHILWTYICKMPSCNDVRIECFWFFLAIQIETVHFQFQDAKKV